MLNAMIRSWPLLFGMLLLMMGQGLLLTLLTLRASGLGFGDAAIGLMQAGYPAGQIIGCLVVPRLVLASGHARCFGALASIASAAALLHLVTGNPAIWGLLRLITGFAYAGLFVVAESWLNGVAHNRDRGALLSLYFVTQAAGSAAGQLFLGLSDPGAVLLFVLVSVLISLALVPILLVHGGDPQIERPEPMRFAMLFRLTPMGVTGALLGGVAQGALYVGLPLFGARLGAAPQQAGLFLVALTLGGVAAQFPVARLSDLTDRRNVITGLAALALALCLPPALMPPGSLITGYALAAGLGALVLPSYSICLAHANDHLSPGQMVAAGGVMVLTLGVGTTIGAFTGPAAIELSGPSGLFAFVALVQALLLATVLFRLWRSSAPAARRGAAMAAPQASTPVSTRLNPDAPALPGDEDTRPPAGPRRPAGASSRHDP